MDLTLKLLYLVVIIYTDKTMNINFRVYADNTLMYSKDFGISGHFKVDSARLVGL